MEFTQLFTAVRERLFNIDRSKIDDNFAVQVTLTGDGGGVFYVANRRGEYAVEPYDYRDRDGGITLDAKLFVDITTDKANSELALATGKIKIEGNPSALLGVLKAAKQSVKAEAKAEKQAEKQADKQAKKK
ncbi:MAG: SCP2 sterol-binding domain-containing protein [Oscillospiraceae bacterium]|jgi:putative sterol carrier protein|nr:SCP2 sterol-binding domain-containing protein [Oscillospiraceae bacterium]